jgi:hypothetical protein
MRTHVATLFSSCLLTATFPCAWKTGIILPFIKDAQKDRTMSNVRPITLQSCLGKLFTKLLAHRLGAIFQRRPILNPAQRGFIVGGTTMKCIDELLDAWDWSRTNQCELYTIFYDIKQAHDSVQLPILVRAMHQLHLPLTFIKLIENSLTDLSSCVRTIYGLTRRFAVRRSLRQGDPLAPLLFIILTDALHDGLELNPFTERRHGCRLAYKTGDVELASLGYADDTAATTNTLDDLRVQNDWVQYFMRFNVLRLNPLKCVLVGRGSDGRAVSNAAVAHHGIAVDSLVLSPLPYDQPIRYLGVHTSFDGSWSAQQHKSRSMVMTFTRLAIKFHLTVSETVYMFNVFLITRLELALHYVHGPNTSAWIKDCDRMLIGCIKHIVSSLLHLSHSAVALTFLVLPSWLETSVKVSELFLRMNSSDPRWGELGRTIMRDGGLSTVDSTTSLPRPDSGSRITRAAYLAVRKLNWDFHLSEQRRLQTDGRRRHLFDIEPLRSLPTSEECSSSPLIHFTEGSARVAHDLWSGWDSSATPLQDALHIYTDGSFDPVSATSAWSVVLGDQWLDSNFATVPSDEKLMQPAHVGGATLIGASITCTQGVYPAELQAIARTLAMFPLSFNLHIHSDSEASIGAIFFFFN